MRPIAVIPTSTLESMARIDAALYQYQIHASFESAYREALASFSVDRTFRTMDARLNKDLRLLAQSARYAGTSYHAETHINLVSNRIWGE